MIIFKIFLFFFGLLLCCSLLQQTRHSFDFNALFWLLNGCLRSTTCQKWTRSSSGLGVTHQAVIKHMLNLVYTISSLEHYRLGYCNHVV